MRYKQLKAELKTLERQVARFKYNISKQKNHNEKIKLKLIVVGLWEEVYFDLYDYRGKIPIDNGKDPLYNKLNQLRDVIGIIENAR